MTGTAAPPVGPRALVQRRRLDTGWEAALVDPSGSPDPDFAWMPASVPGTAAGVLRAAGREIDRDLDDTDWSFRTTFDAEPAGGGEEVVLRIGGIATLATVHLNGQPILASASMFAEHVIDVGALLVGRNELRIDCHALGPELARPRRPRARWRSRLVADGALRWFRTTLLGRAPGFAPGPAIVGPWRPIELERRVGIVVEDVRIRPSVAADGCGILSLSAAIRELGEHQVLAATVHLSGPSGRHQLSLALDQPAEAGADGAAGQRRVAGELRVHDVARWWPHTHGEPALHEVRLELETSDGPRSMGLGRVGFRTIAPGAAGHRVEVDGLDFRVNERSVFLRGAVWTPADPDTLTATEPLLLAVLVRARDAGLNLLRIPGFAAYEDDAFHALCDELGILVWQDLTFANLDYPFADPAFRALALAEVRWAIDRLAGRPSVAIICGNSEIEQQVAMVGLPSELGRADFFATEVPALMEAGGTDAIYIPSTPFGGDRPFQTDVGIANYYGVGGYRRPLEDVRQARVRFAAECLAFANIPDDDALASLEAPVTNQAGIPVAVGGPAWKAGVPRDNGAGWDFEDVRDHYLAALYDVDPIELRSTDPARYLALGRLASGEAMAHVFGEWRRTGSRCGGGIVLWLRDLRPGAGWGVLDHRGEPKVAWHHLRRALAPIAVWMTNEGLNGIHVHVANDRPTALHARLRVAFYQDDEVRVDEAVTDLRIGPAETIERDVEALLGRFVDASWAYRFGPATRTLIVASLETTDAGPSANTTGPMLLSQAFQFPTGRPNRAEPALRLGLAGVVVAGRDGPTQVELSTRRYAHGVRLRVPGFVADDDAFGLEPGPTRTIALRPDGTGRSFVGGSVTAANLVGSIALGAGSGVESGGGAEVPLA